MKMYVCIGIEAFKMAEIKGMFSSRKKAQLMADKLEKEKHFLHCQNFKASSWTEANKKYELYC